MTQWLIEETAFSTLDELELAHEQRRREDEERQARLEAGALRALGRHR